MAKRNGLNHKLVSLKMVRRNLKEKRDYVSIPVTIGLLLVISSFLAMVVRRHGYTPQKLHRRSLFETDGKFF